MLRAAEAAPRIRTYLDDEAARVRREAAAAIRRIERGPGPPARRAPDRPEGRIGVHAIAVADSRSVPC